MARYGCERERERECEREREYMLVCNVPMLHMTCALDVHVSVFVYDICAMCS